MLDKADEKVENQGIAITCCQHCALANKYKELGNILKQLHASTRVLPDSSLEPLYARRGVRIVGRYGFQQPPTGAHGPALRCLNNILVRSVDSRNLLSPEIGAKKIVATLKARSTSAANLHMLMNVAR